MMASIPNSNPVAPTTRPVHKTRKRAPKACLSCRARKVRCDVSQRGRPCMNCYLDSETCVVTGRASRFRKGEREGKEGPHGTTMEDIMLDSGVTGEPDAPPAQLIIEPHAGEKQHAPHSSTFERNGQAGIPAEQQSSYSGLQGHPESVFNRPPSPTRLFNNASSIPIQNFEPLGNPEIPLWVGDNRVTVNADITYSYYPFLSINNLHNVMPQDVNYLESQGCLRVPTRPILDEFVQQYFLHVHPLLPFINEGDFWELYCHQDSGGTGEKMSLLVFQAMLFSCCNYVSKSNIKALGFPNIRAARATLYRRTKLLFDFDTESSLVCLAQTALLLTYWAPNWSLATKKPNTAWLGVAIQNAKSAEAHIYSAMPTFSPVTEPIEYKKQNAMKRLWWCCVIRDRLISLGMRRSIQISRAHFDVDANSGLAFPDLEDEMERSKVYNSETKRRLIEIFVQLGELCCVLTDLLTLVFPLDDVPGWGRHNGSEGADKVRECKTALRRWYKTATLRFPMFGKTTGDEYRLHDSIILYTNLMYMFYHSARAALCHHEVLQAAMASASPNLNSNLRGVSKVYESRHELQDAACGVTECLNELIQRGLARWLPISAISCTAMPLVLHIIDVKLSSQNKRSRATPDERRQTALKQHRLNILIEAMKTYQPQYDGVDYISETIRHIVNLAQIDPPTNSATTTITSAPSQGATNNSMQPIISDWTDILASQPGSYLRLSMTMDISISKGRLAEETDFPVKLRGLFAQGFSPIRALLAGTQPPAPAYAAGGGATLQTPTLFGPNPGAHIQPGSVQSMSSDEDSTSPDSVEAIDHYPTRILDNSNNNNNQQVSGHIPLPRPSQVDSTMPRNQEDVPMNTKPTEMFTPIGLGLSLDTDYSLTSDALAAYMLQMDDESIHMSEESATSSGDHDMYDGNGDGDGKEVDWIEQAWDDERGDGREVAGADTSDKETARVLLDALRDDDAAASASAVPCAV